MEEAMTNVNQFLQVQGKPGLSGLKNTGGAGGNAIPGVQATTQAEYDKLPKGAHYVDPNGKTRIKG